MEHIESPHGTHGCHGGVEICLTAEKLVFNADTRIVGTMDDIPLACLSAACTVGGGIWFWD